MFLFFLSSLTLGELKLSKIQKNVKQNIQDNISLFSLGIGFDVDYDFLKRLSSENHGIAQRIYGNQDTSSQLKVAFPSGAFSLLVEIIQLLISNALRRQLSLTQICCYFSHISLTRFKELFNSFLTDHLPPLEFCTIVRWESIKPKVPPFATPEQKVLLRHSISCWLWVPLSHHSSYYHGHLLSL
jgi:hypothetical protein